MGRPFFVHPAPKEQFFPIPVDIDTLPVFEPRSMYVKLAFNQIRLWMVAVGFLRPLPRVFLNLPFSSQFDWSFASLNAFNSSF